MRIVYYFAILDEDRREKLDQKDTERKKQNHVSMCIAYAIVSSNRLLSACMHFNCEK